jgi:predicted NBD/HSP70 family sugar kinase
MPSKIAQAIGQPVIFDWEHDGTAAALAYTHLPNSAAITFGTAIGGAITPEIDLRPLAPALQFK